MLSLLSIEHAKRYAPNWFNCLTVCPFGVKSGKYYSKEWEIDAVLKVKDSNCVGILSDQEDASNLNEYTILDAMLAPCMHDLSKHDLKQVSEGAYRNLNSAFLRMNVL